MTNSDEELEEQESLTGENEQDLDTIKQVEVPFLNEMILALLGGDDEIYVPVVPFGQNLGLSAPRKQITRIKRDDTLAAGLRRMPIETAGGAQKTQCLRLDMFTIWLIGVREQMCKEEVRPKLSHYKRESARAILNHFKNMALLRAAAPATVTHLPVPSPEASFVDMAVYHEGLAALYRSLSTQQAHIDQHETRLDRHDEEIAALSEGFQGMKATLSYMGEMAAELTVSPQQAADIQQLVGTIHEHTGIHRGTIFGAFKKQFAIPRYDELPAALFDSAMEWLRQWGRAQLSRKK